jgi:hypothetical protein
MNGSDQLELELDQRSDVRLTYLSLCLEIIKHIHLNLDIAIDLVPVFAYAVDIDKEN